MREFETIIDYISKGLRPRGRSSRNVEGLTECYNLRCGSRGLEFYQPLTDPLSNINLKPSWPFPQLLNSNKYRFLIIRDSAAGEDLIYEVASDWSLTLILAVDVVTFGTGFRWSVADFDEYVLLTNGVVMVYRDTVADAFIPTLTLTNTPRCNTVCDFKGQLIGGAVRSSWYDGDTSSIIWSDIGSISCTPDEKNEAGFRRHPYEGEVYQVMRLGDNVIVYGSRGVMAMRPAQQTFQFVELYDKGIYSRYAAGGDKHQQVFVDEKGFVFRLDQNLKLEKLGYEEFTQQMGDIVISYDDEELDFYLSDGVRSYLLSEQGLSEIGESPSSILCEDGLLGLFVDLEDDDVRLTTDLIDMGYRGQKTSEVVEVGVFTDGLVKVGIDWRIDKKDSLSRTDLVEVNNQGVVAIRVVGTEFRVHLECSNFDGFDLDYLKLRYKMTDMRSIRGVYAPPPRGQ